MSNSDEEVILELLQGATVKRYNKSKHNPAFHELQPSDFVARANVSEHTYRLIKLILHSHLMFSNDSKAFLSCVPEVIVHSKRYRHGCIAMTLAAGLNVGIILFNKYSASSHLGNLSVIPICLITVGSTGYVLKLISNYYKEQSFEKVLKNHIKILQKFYSRLQNILCDIKYVDVMDIDSALKSQTSESHDHKIAIPLRKLSIMVLITLIKIRKTMLDGLMSLREQIPQTIEQIDFATTDTRNFLPDNIYFDETKISVDDLSNMNCIYQLVQSEYLRWLALCFFPMQPRDEILTKKVCVNVVDSVHSLVLKSYTELKSQHTINFCRCIRSVTKANVADFAHTDLLTVGNASDCELTESDISVHCEHQVVIGTSFSDTSMATGTSVIDSDVTEYNTAVATDSWIPKSPAVDITDPTLLADSWASAVSDSSESIICLPLSATEYCRATAHTVPVHPSPMRVGHLKMLSAQKTLIEEEFGYDGDSESEWTD